MGGHDLICSCRGTGRERLGEVGAVLDCGEYGGHQEVEERPVLMLWRADGAKWKSA